MIVDVPALVQTYGLWTLTPFAILEGPIVTVIAAFLAAQGYLPLWGVFLSVVLGEVIGDGLIYGLGRGMLPSISKRWQDRFGLTPLRLNSLATSFESKGTKLLLFGKWTHAAGFAVLIGAGAARMPFAKFLWISLLATLPKSGLFMAIGYVFGNAHAEIDGWISNGSLVLFAIMTLSIYLWMRSHKKDAQHDEL